MKPDGRRLLAQIWRLTWPTTVHSVLELTLGVVDLLMVRSFGEEATAAIGLSRQVTFLVAASAMAMSIGVVTLVSQGIGAGDRKLVDGVVRQSVALVFVLGLPLALVGVLLSRPLLVAMQAEPATLAYGVGYLHVCFAGIAFLWAEFLFGAIFRGAGDALTPLKIAAVVNVLNVALNYVFIFGLGPIPAFEVRGAAMGTVFARALGAAVLLALLWRGTDKLRLRFGGPWREEADVTRRILRIGVPFALAGVLRNSSRLVFLAILGASSLGATIHAAVGVGLQMRLIAVLPALAFQFATATLVGQAIGRGDYDEAEEIGRASVFWLAIVMLALGVVIFLFAHPLAVLFIADPSAVALTATVLRWFAFAQFFSAVAIGTQGALNGAGDTAPAARYMLLSQWFVMLPLSYVLLVTLDWGPQGALFAWTVAPLITLILTQRRFRSGVWRKMKV